MKHSVKNILGMELMCFEHRGVDVAVAEFSDTATIYYVKSANESKGFATETLGWIQGYYEGQGKKLCSSVSLCPAMSHILRKLRIREYN